MELECDGGLWSDVVFVIVKILNWPEIIVFM